MKILLSAALLGSTMTLGGIEAALADGVWRDPVDISPAAQSGSTPQITSSADGRNLASVWISNNGLQSRATGAFSTDRGVTWSPAVAINAPNGDSSGIRLAASRDGRRAVATYIDFQAPDKEIVRTTTLAEGDWSAPVDVSSLASSTGSPSPAVAMSADGGRAVVVYAQFQGSTHQIQARTSSDSGATYGAPVPVAANVAEPEDIQVVSSENGQRLTAVWKETIGGLDAIRASFSVNSGGTWSSPERLSTLTRDAITPDLVTSADGSTTVAVWREKVSDTERLIHTRTLNAGFWSPSQRLSPLGQSSITPQVSAAQDGSRATVVWANTTANHIQGAHGVGDSWSEPRDVSEPGTQALKPDVASGADGRRVVAVWLKPSNQILSSQSVDGGATWSVPTSASATALGTDSPQVAAADSGFRFAAAWSRFDGTDVRIQAGTLFEAQGQTITFAQPNDVTVGSSTEVAATATSGLPVALAVGTPDICTLSGSRLTAIAAGVCSITASQPGDVDFAPAAEVTRTVQAVAATAPVVLGKQQLACAKTPPRTLKRRGTTVVLPKNCRTDAGQRVTVRVDGKRKDLRRVKVLKKAGKTVVRTFGTRVRLTVTYRAAGTSDVEAFRQVRRYRT